MAEQTISMNHNSSKPGLLDSKSSADVLKGDSSPPYNNNNDQSDASNKSAGTQGNNADGVQAKTSKFQITSVNPKQPHHSDVDVEVENDSNDEIEETFSRKNATATKDLAAPAATNNSQTTGESRFQIVKIETSEPFHRGRFKCMDYRENPRDEAAAVSSSRGDEQISRITEINREMVSGSGTSSTSSSLHYVPGEQPPSENPIPVSGVLDDKGRENLVAPKPHYPTNASQQPYTNGSVPGVQQTSIPQKPMVEEPKQQQSPPAAMVPVAVAVKEQVQELQGGASEDASLLTSVAGTTSPIQTISDLEKNLRASLASPEPTQSVEIPRFYVVKVAESEPESKQQETPSTAAPEPEPVLLSPPSLIAATLDSSGVNPPNSDIDNKIEQAMDLVKTHLMMAVREEVEELKLKIQDLMKTITDLTEKNGVLEKENRALRAQVSPEPQPAMPDASSLSTQQPSAPSGAVQ